MVPERINRNLLVTSLVLLLVIVISGVSNIDISIQNYFYYRESSEWILDRDNQLLNFIFYSGVKKLIILFFVGVLLSLIFFRKTEIIKKYQQGLIVVLLSGIFVPLIVSGLKLATNKPCPRNISHYGGNNPDIKIFDQYPKDFIQKSRSRCWPAGHASGGFALLSLFFLFKTKRNKVKSLIFAMIIGWSIATYKMFVGDHFLSHSIITMIIAWLVILINLKIVQKIQNNKNEKSAEI